jgi:hypothetical protein
MAFQRHVGGKPEFPTPFCETFSMHIPRSTQDVHFSRPKITYLHGDISSNVIFLRMTDFVHVNLEHKSPTSRSSLPDRDK